MGRPYLSEGLAVALAGLLGEQQELPVLLVAAVHLVEAGQQAQQQQQGDQTQQGQDHHVQVGQLEG